MKALWDRLKHPVVTMTVVAILLCLAWLEAYGNESVVSFPTSETTLLVEWQDNSHTMEVINVLGAGFILCVGRYDQLPAVTCFRGKGVIKGTEVLVVEPAKTVIVTLSST